MEKRLLFARGCVNRQNTQSIAAKMGHHPPLPRRGLKRAVALNMRREPRRRAYQAAPALRALSIRRRWRREDREDSQEK